MSLIVGIEGAVAHLELAKNDLNCARRDNFARTELATLAIGEALTGLLEVLIGVTGDRGSVIDVRAEVRGSGV